MKGKSMSPCPSAGQSRPEVVAEIRRPLRQPLIERRHCALPPLYPRHQVCPRQALSLSFLSASAVLILGYLFRDVRVLQKELISEWAGLPIRRPRASLVTRLRPRVHVPSQGLIAGTSVIKSAEVEPMSQPILWLSHWIARPCTAQGRRLSLQSEDRQQSRACECCQGLARPTPRTNKACGIYPTPICHPERSEGSHRTIRHVRVAGARSFAPLRTTEKRSCATQES